MGVGGTIDCEENGTPIASTEAPPLAVQRMGQSGSSLGISIQDIARCYVTDCNRAEPDGSG